MSTKKLSSEKYKKILLFPIIMCIGFVPLIVHYYRYDTNFSQFDWYQDTTSEVAELFLGWKMIVTILMGILMLGILVYLFLKESKLIRFATPFYCLIGYAVLVLLSGLFSPYKYWVTRGTYELLEPIWVVFTCIILCYYTYCCVDDEMQVYTLVRWSALGMILLLMIGALQSFGKDLLSTSFANMLFLNPSQWGQDDMISMYAWGNVAYSTLYNPNYVSFYSAIVLMLFIGLLFGAKKTWEKGIVLVGIVYALVCLWGSRSLSGFIALAISLVAVFLVLMSRKWKSFILGCVIFVGGIVGMVLLLQNPEIREKSSSAFLGSFKLEDVAPVRSIETREDCAALDIEGNMLYVSYDIFEDGTFAIACRDDEGKEIPILVQDENTKTCILDDERFTGVAICPVRIGDSLGVQVNYWQTWNFKQAEDGTYKLLNSVGKWVDMSQSKASRLFNDDAMSGRGRIWNNTIPLLAGHILLGSGANTFGLEYPQDDLIYKAFWGTYSSMDVKAHCWYLQQWVEEGFLALLCVLAFLTWYWVDSIRLYRRADFKQSFTWIGFGVFGAITAFLAGALVNDVMAGVAQVIWGLFGLGWAINRILWKEIKN